MLVVWLPLTGDLHNQGLTQATATVSGTTSFNTAGKIGQSLTCNGSSFWTITPVTLGNAATIACWTKTSTGGKMPWVITASSSDRLNLYESGQYTLNTGDGNNNPFKDTNGNTISVLTDNAWHHFVVTFDGTVSKLYIDGVYRGTATTYRNPTTTSAKIVRLAGGYGGGHSYDWNGSINDFRIYDHCLSPKEVEEIAKGLVLHYELNDRFCEATTNLYSTLDGVSTSCYNGSNGKYGYGSNSNVYKTTGIFNERQSLKIYMGTSGSSARPYPYFSNLFTSDGTNAPAYKTLSFDYYGTIGTYLNFYKLGSGSGTGNWKNITNNTSGSFTNSGSITVTTNKWQHIELTLHGTTNANAEWGYCILGDAHTSNTSNYWLFANIQLETKDHATGFAGYGATRTPTTIYDSSGYSNNGTITGSLTAAAGSPRYDVCTHIPATSSKIHISNLTTSGFGNSYSFAWWGKRDSNSPMFWGFSDGIRLNGMYIGNLWNTGDGSNNPLYNIGTTTQVTAPSTNIWHHYVMTGNGSKCYVYLDGELWAEAKTYKAISGTSIYINGWDSGTQYCSNNTDISDFRIYATALTAAQVQELYNTSMSVDSNGNVYARELVEL